MSGSEKMGDGALQFGELSKYQARIDEQYKEFIKKDFEVKLNFHRKMQDILRERDTVLRERMSREERRKFIEKALANFELMQEFLPINSQKTYDVSVMKFITAEYLPDYRVRVELELDENEYVKDEVLTRTIGIFGCDTEPARINWADEQGKCPLFDFFEAEEDDLEAFDIIYDFYVNMIMYAELE